MLKYSAATLKRLEDLFKQFQYKVRYEKGQFQAGYCIVQNQRVIVINKFYTTDARINCLVDILQEVELDVNLLDKDMLAYYESIKAKLDKAAAEDEEGIIDTSQL